MSEPNKPGETPGTGTGETPAADSPPKWDEWLPQQPEPVRSLIEQHTTGLKSALTSEREQRKQFEADLKKLSKGLEGDARAQLETIQQRLASESQRASFYESAAAAGVGDFKLAYIAARESGLLTDSGGCDFARLKEHHPFLFKTTPTTTPGHAGNGANGAPPKPTQNMTEWVRAQLR